MYELVYMDEASNGSVINMPLPDESAPAEVKDNFATIYFEPVVENYKVSKL